MRRLILVASLLLAAAGPALCIVGAVPAQAAIQTSAEHGLLMDAASGQVLWQKDGMVPMPPASMSKLMTVELVFQRLKDGRLKLTDTLAVSEQAWRTGGSKGFVRVGDRLTIQDLLLRIIVASGNDACVVVAEGLGGTFDGFVAMMNKRARELGLNQSTFVNPDGLPDPPGQLMSAFDLARLSRHLINDYPQYYHFFSEKSYTVSDQGKTITQPNRDLVLGSLQGADGLKTGHTDAAGYGITISAKRGDTRFILVLNGLRYPQYKIDYFPNIRRAEEAARVMEAAFREFRSYPVLTANQVVGNAPLALGVADSVPVTAIKPLSVTMQVDSHAALKTALTIDPGLTAPVAQGQKVGSFSISAPDFPTLTVPVYAVQPVAKIGLIETLWRRVFHKK